MAAATLDDLVNAWSHTSRHDGPIDAGRLRNWIEACETKARMRLACELGLAETPADAFRRFCRQDTVAILAEAAILSPERLSPVSMADLSVFDLKGVEHTFLPLALHEASDVLLVHLTHDPDRILEDGFHGTHDVDALSATFMKEKTPDGFNFAFQAGSFDLENFSSDGFYGFDAIVFRARHLSTLNLESSDHEVIFRGGDVAVADMIHLRESDAEWCVLDVDGEVLASDASISACLEWVARNETMEARLKGVRTYDARRPSEDEMPTVVTPRLTAFLRA